MTASPTRRSGPAGWTEDPFPAMLDLGDRRVLVVGGGSTAEEKIKLLIDAGADIVVVSPELTPSLAELAHRGVITWRSGRFQASDVDGAFFVVAATDDPVVNGEVFEASEAAATLCNAVDDTRNCSAILPSVHRDGSLVVAVSTSGAAPALAVRLRQRIAELTAGYGRVLDLLAGYRSSVKGALGTFPERKEAWYRIVDSPAIETARQGDVDAARAALDQLMGTFVSSDHKPGEPPLLRADRLIRTTLAWAQNPMLTISGQLGGLVLVDLVRRRRPDIAVVFVDTGYHPPESIDFVHRVADRWDLQLRVVRPALDVAEHEDLHGKLYLADPAACCAMRKVAPADEAMDSHDVWFTAVRREQAETRRAEPVLATHVRADGSPLWKLNPLVDWTWEDVESYAASRRVPRHPLYDQGYTSIGCDPCTMPTFGTGDDRGGRWMGSDRVECGLHIGSSSTGTAS